MRSISTYNCRAHRATYSQHAVPDRAFRASVSDQQLFTVGWLVGWLVVWLLKSYILATSKVISVWCSSVCVHSNSLFYTVWYTHHEFHCADSWMSWALLFYILTTYKVHIKIGSNLWQCALMTSAIILHIARVFIDPTPGVPFQILMPPIPPMPPIVRDAIIEYAHK